MKVIQRWWGWRQRARERAQGRFTAATQALPEWQVPACWRRQRSPDCWACGQRR